MNQGSFLKKIENLIPENTSLVNELSELLNISIDSAYRRLRGSTLLNINEITILCKHYHISFDVFDDTDIDNVAFSFHDVKYDYDSFYENLKIMTQNLNLIKNSKNSKIIYACEDMPIFYNYKYPNLSAFKIFYWMEAILNKSDISTNKYVKDIVPQRLIDEGKEIFESYISISSIEIWTDLTYVSVLKQVEFFWDLGKFENDEDVIAILDELTQLLEDIRNQAKIGRKLHYKDIEKGQKAEYELYLSEIEIGNNCVLVDLESTKNVYLGHMSFNTISTSNKRYSERTNDWISNLIKKSTPISNVSEKYRYQYFKKAFQQISDLKDKIEK